MERYMALICCFSDDIGMVFGLSKCAVLSVCKGEVVPSKILPDIPQLDEEEGYKYLGIMKSTDFLVDQVKAKMNKEYALWVRKILDANLTMQNTITAICAYDVPVMRYTFGIVKQNKSKLSKLDNKMRKMLTTHGLRHPAATHIACF
eukprot:7828056-Ditylum_brightwellii.AAC.1